MNSKTKRSRGRPPGTGLDDSAILAQIAERMAADQNLRATTALCRIDPEIHPSSKRRIQAKWRAQGERLLFEARAKRAQPVILSRSKSVRADGDALRSGALTASQLADAIARNLSGLSGLAATKSDLATPAMRAFMEYQRSPAAQAILEFQNSPTMRAMREFQDSPGMQAMRELQDSPAFRAIRELHNRPTMKAIRDAQAKCSGVWP